MTSKCHSKFILWVGRDGPNVSHLSKSHDVFEIWCLTGGFYLFLMRVLNCLLIIVIIILIYWHIISTHTGRNNLSMSILKVVISNCKCNVYFITLYLVKTTEFFKTNITIVSSTFVIFPPLFHIFELDSSKKKELSNIVANVICYVI